MAIPLSGGEPKAGAVPRRGKPRLSHNPAEMGGSATTPPQRTLAAVPEERRTEALRRWRVLRPHLEDGAPLPSTAAAAGVPLRTAQRWLTRYRADGLAGLARSTRADRGSRRLPDELRLLIEGLALRPPAPSAAHVHRIVTGVAKDQGWRCRRTPRCTRSCAVVRFPPASPATRPGGRGWASERAPRTSAGPSDGSEAPTLRRGADTQRCNSSCSGPAGTPVDLYRILLAPRPPTLWEPLQAVLGFDLDRR